MAKNANLAAAKSAKNDEFYTLYDDINAELCHYVEHFKDKIVFCNCDDPESSNFWKFFVQNFHNYGIKKVVSTHYNHDGSPSYKLEYTGQELNGQQVWVKTELKENGDFRSEECIKILKEADIIVTNPPFSLFRAFVAQLMEYEKKFIIIGNKNAITYKEFFPFLKDNKVWIGYTSPNEFKTPTGEITKQVTGLTRWFTNLDIEKRHELLLKPYEAHYKYYGHELDYPKYDNYDAIEVGKVSEIPDDYYDVIGVPITFLDKHNPDEFEIVGLSMAGCNENSLNLRKDYKKYLGYKQDGTKTGRTGSTFGACPVLVQDDGKTVYYELNGIRVQATYCRVFIKRKEIDK